MAGATGYHLEKKAHYIHRKFNFDLGADEILADYWTDYLPYNGVTPQYEVQPILDDSYSSPAVRVGEPIWEYIYDWDETGTDHKYRIRACNSDLGIYTPWCEDPDEIYADYGG